MNRNWLDKKRITEQLKFFGAKKQMFISVYAKKPRILVKITNKTHNSTNESAMNDCLANERERQLSALYRSQLNMGIANSSLGFNQMAQAQQAQYNQSQLMNAQAQTRTLYSALIGLVLYVSIRPIRLYYAAVV